MANVRVRLNLRGLNKIMTSTAVQKRVDEEGRDLASRAGVGFEYVQRPHARTARGYVQPEDAAAMRKQAKQAVLERALGERSAGRETAS